jgi:AraC-like DNA-binding protein
MFDLGEITRAVSLSPMALPVQTRSNEEAREILSRRYKSHAMEVAGDGRDFDFLHASARLAGCSFNILRYGAGVVIDPGDFDEFYMLEIPLSGGVELHFNDRVCVSNREHGLIISPGRALTSVWQPGTVQMMLKIDKRFVLSRMRALTERPARAHPMFDPLIALGEPQGWRIASLMSLLMQDFLRSITGAGWDFSKSPLATAIVDALLLGASHDQSAAMGGRAADILPRHVKRSTRYIDEHFAGEISVPRLAEIADTSERSLYEGFRKFLHVSPQQYLTERRLKAAREMLLSGSQPVAVVARLCGFGHLGRFAKAYRERYLEYPSETARH